MSERLLTDLSRHWSKLNRRVLERLRACECPVAVLFVSADDSASETARKLCQHLSEATMDFGGQTPTKEQWHEAVGHLEPTDEAPALFDVNPKPDKPCVLLVGLDDAPEWLWVRVKSLLERQGTPPFRCIATAADAGRIPAWLSSHFTRCKKVGRPRTKDT